MLTIDVRRVALLKGITEPYAFLRKNGFTHHVAKALVNGASKSIRYDHLERLCRCLHALPHDLLAYKPHGRGLNPANDVLLPLRKQPIDPKDLQNLLATLSPEEIIRLTSELQARYQQPPAPPEGQ